MNEILYRTAPLLRADMPTGRTIHGLAVPYGVETDVGGYTERFQYGTFAKSIRQRGDKVKLFTGHQHQKLPIGRATDLRETADGLHAAFLVSDTRDGNEALQLVRDGVVDSFSIGFKPITDQRDGNVVVRTEAALMEVSLVGIPAYPGAVVAGVRSQPQNLSVDIARRRIDLLLHTWT